MRFPCYKCPFRSPPCHDDCEKYKIAKKTIEVENEKRKKAWKAEHDWFVARGLTKK